MQDAFSTIKPSTIGTSLFEDRKSLFYGFVTHVTSEEEAIAFRTSIKEQIPDARHYVSAYIIHEGDVKHYSDAKEPHGTAGLPVFNVIQGHGLQDVVVVVARIFGGTLLGKGGLMRAYTKAATMAVEDAQLAVNTLCMHFDVCVPYPLYDQFLSKLEVWGVTLLDQSFAENITVSLELPIEAYDETLNKIIEFSNGRIQLIYNESCWVLK